MVNQMTDYAQHFSTLRTPQSEQADKRQVQNSAGGFTFQTDKWKQLDRWLILGADGGSYYATERELTIKNAQAVQSCLSEDGPRTVEAIAALSESGRAPKNDPAIFALAMACGSSDKATRLAALTALPRVCRIGTHLFHFAKAARAFRGWGRGLRAAVSRWYAEKTPEQVAFQVAKYGQRDGWSHRDLLRLCHGRAHNREFRYVACGADGLGPREVKRKSQGAAVSYDGVGDLPAFLAAFEELKATRDESTAVRLIREHRFTHEMVPSELKNSVAVWEALIQDMPMTAMIRNLAKMTAVGLLKPMSAPARYAAERIASEELLKKARVHPLSLLSALKVYEQGHGEKGKLSWSPERQIVDALDEAFYLAFDAIEPTGKRMLLALDVSGSMFGGTIAGTPGITPGVGAAAMAMATARAEKNWHVVGFSSGAPGEYTHGAGGSRWSGYRSGMTPISVSPRQRLDDIVKAMQSVPMGGTDCALPMLYASAKELEVDCFVLYTDNETWAGAVHPHQALKSYRDKSGINAKMAVCGMVGNDFTIADPSDPGQLDFIGFDTSAPAILSDFAKGV
jgi:60 kDa SS-A/Ro ribonucleoprotein